MDEVVAKVLKCNDNIHTHMDDITEQVNNRLRDLSIPYLAKFISMFVYALMEIF